MTAHITVADRALYRAHAETVVPALRPDMAFAEEPDHAHRSPRFPDGWWLAPSFALGLAFWGIVGGYLAHAYVTHGSPDAALSAVQAEAE